MFPWDGCDHELCGALSLFLLAILFVGLAKSFVTLCANQEFAPLVDVSGIWVRGYKWELDIQPQFAAMPVLSSLCRVQCKWNNS
jgi:hypothetical protein